MTGLINLLVFILTCAAISIGMAGIFESAVAGVITAAVLIILPFGFWCIKRKPKGLYQQYQVRKLFGDMDPRAQYIVLRVDEFGDDLDWINACRKAVVTLANEIELHLPELAVDLRSRYAPPVRPRADPVEDPAPEFRSEDGGIGNRLVAYWPMDGDQDAPAVKRDPHYKGSTRQDFYDGAAGGEEDDAKVEK